MKKLILFLEKKSLSFILVTDLDDHRQIPTKYFANAVVVIYGDKYAVLVGIPEDFRVCLLKNKAVLKV